LKNRSGTISQRPYAAPLLLSFPFATTSPPPHVRPTEASAIIFFKVGDQLIEVAFATYRRVSLGLGLRREPTRRKRETTTDQNVAARQSMRFLQRRYKPSKNPSSTP
jgi:hypothetical protein